MKPKPLNSRVVRWKFDQLAGLYDEHAALEQEVATRLLDRLEFHRITPQRIVDMGCGTGQASAALKNEFREAEVIALDSSSAMLVELGRKFQLDRRLRAVCADLSKLPLADQSSELLFSNLAMQWCPDLDALLAEFRRVLIPGGMLLFTSYGPGSLSELREARAATEGYEQPREFVDILELGDALMAAGFKEPVVDTERITLSYPDFDSLLCELDATGATGILQDSSMAEVKDALEAAYQPARVEGRFPVTYEIIYGTAFGPSEACSRKTPHAELAMKISVGSLSKSDKSKG
jgi:malonyl-CoA O-methyltransferase